MLKETAAVESCIACGAYNERGIKNEILLQTTTSWDGTRYAPYPAGQPELTLMKIWIPANTELSWHIHPYPCLVYLLAGELQIELKENNKKLLLSEGDSMAEVVDRIHRGRTGNDPAELMVFYSGTVGIPVAITT